MDTTPFQTQLEQEKKTIEGTLSSIGRQETVGNAKDWEPSFPDLNPLQMERSEQADEIEEFDNRIGIETTLENRLEEVEEALERIHKGTFGLCLVGGEKIDEDRLRANPAAKTCVKHAYSNA